MAPTKSMKWPLPSASCAAMESRARIAEVAEADMALDWLDQSGAVRPGEELDIVKLDDYLRLHLVDFRGPLTIEQFPSGYSNLTYLLRTGDRQLVLRRPPFGARIK